MLPKLPEKRQVKLKHEIGIPVKGRLFHYLLLLLLLRRKKDDRCFLQAVILTPLSWERERERESECERDYVSASASEREIERGKRES